MPILMLQSSQELRPLAKAFGRLQHASACIAEIVLNDPDEGAAATDYLRLFGFTAFGYARVRAAKSGAL